MELCHSSHTYYIERSKGRDISGGGEGNVKEEVAKDTLHIQ